MNRYNILSDISAGREMNNILNLIPLSTSVVAKLEQISIDYCIGFLPYFKILEGPNQRAYSFKGPIIS